jgi:hypothetical protein
MCLLRFEVHYYPNIIICIIYIHIMSIGSTYILLIKRVGSVAGTYNHIVTIILMYKKNCQILKNV